MPTQPPPPALPALGSLTELAQLLAQAEGFPQVLAALQAGHSATVDGAWGSSNALVCAALGLHAPATLLIALAHPGDLDAWADDLTSFAGERSVLFPAWDQWPPPGEGIDETTSQRLRLLQQLDSVQPPRCLLTTFQALMQPVPARAQLAQQRRRLQVGASVDLEELAGWLVEHGFQRADAVHLPGEFTRRGGILDVFSPDAEAPYRLEFFGDEIESIRQFTPATQRSLDKLTTIDLIGTSQPTEGGGTGHLTDYLPAHSWTVLVEPNDLREQGKHFLERVTDGRGLFSLEGVFQQLLRLPSVYLTALPSASLEATCHLRVESVERFSGEVAKVRDELASVAGGSRVVIACHNEAEIKRLGEVLAGRQGDKETGRQGDKESEREKGEDVYRREADSASLSPCLPVSLSPCLLVGSVRAGFRLVDAGLLVLSDNELFHREAARPIQPRRRLESRAIDSFLELNEDDLVVHVGHGIARYRGMKMLEKAGRVEEHLTLEFRDGLLLYVPISMIDLVQKYVGGSRTEPELSKLGGTRWQRTKEKVEAATFDLAQDMVELQALRAAQPGIAYPPDSDWQRAFEAAFPYQETPDQLTTLSELKGDMERTRPMDRLICGDVGYGKTELAMRAAFKAVDNGRQVAVLVPTTVLAEQHYRTFGQRLAEYPFVVEGISRFRTAGQQKRILDRLGKGGVDIIIGTHRLVSPDVKFKDLGLVIIDEEQRFGVEHKERLKKLRQTVDVLTLTATPIPRTLHLSLLGIRDISNLETPPQDRLAIETRISRFDPTLLRHAIVRELNREGQVYFVHNRVHNIKDIANKLNEIVPEARIAIAHGQMSESELEQAMVRFVRKECDILVATTIIESGLDIPNANTIFINQADNYGLADLHQLRGRVGRYKHRAYAYLLLDSEKSLTSVAARRLKAIEEFTELGAGFKIALRDLEIRGAGNILGTQQSGHIAAVGYELYCQLLENAVRQKKNQPVKTPLEIALDLPWPAYLPRDYVEGQRQRMEVYRRLARVRRLDKLEDFGQELRDRYGPLPETAQWLLRQAELRVLAARWQIGQIRLESQGSEDSAPASAARQPLASGGRPPPVKPHQGTDKRQQGADAARSPTTSRPLDVVLHYRNARKIAQLAEQSRGRLRVVDEKTAYFRLKPNERADSALYACLKDLLRLPERSV